VAEIAFQAVIVAASITFGLFTARIPFSIIRKGKVVSVYD